MHVTLKKMTCRTRAAICGAAVTLLGAVPCAVVQSQTLPVAGPQRATRSELTSLLAATEQKLSAGSLKDDARIRAMSEVSALKTRLTRGDFLVGDRFIVTVRRDSEKTDTVAVRDSLNVNFAGLPDISLGGALRSELDERLSTHVARYLRNTTVRTNVLTRVAVLGQVGRPGFYYADPARPVSDLVMLAGGPGPDANLKELEIRRGTGKLLTSKDSQRAIIEGRTLEQLDVQSGDEVTISVKKKINWQLVIQVFFIFSSLFFAVIQFLQWYYGRKAG